jgi:hypothetical protein
VKPSKDWRRPVLGDSQERRLRPAILPAGPTRSCVVLDGEPADEPQASGDRVWGRVDGGRRAAASCGGRRVGAVGGGARKGNRPI